MTLNIAIAGVTGRMGQALVRAAAADSRFHIAGGAAREGSRAIGADLGVLAGLPALGVTASADTCAVAEGAEIWIDFTTPDATTAALDALRGTKVRAAVVGATGLTRAQHNRLNDAAQRMGIVYSGNFSLGVNVLAALVRQAAERLGPDWDIEITDAHHRRKVDAPSGTALLLGEAAAQGRRESLADLRLAPHDGAGGARRPGGIGFSVIRAGGIIGEHDVRFAAEHEVLTLSHQALDRAVFADGALAAALWAAKQPPGLYSMSDVLGL